VRGRLVKQGQIKEGVVKSVGVGFVVLLAVLVTEPSFSQAAKIAPTKPQAGQSAAPAPRQAGDVPIARSVFLTRMDSEFRKMDADRNGTVTRAEIEAFESAVSVLKARAKNRQLFARLDADGNGQLSAAEFSRLASPGRVDAAPVMSRMDLNRDQSISLVEYRTATLANFDRMDADKDGIVTPAEMKARGIGR
jgi:Ca2+-binding EF-hand superfamily protein